ncbi:MAG: TIGR01210 family radical SAM protein, partial [Candidatus Methanofastidiosia archaeon]
LRGFENLEVAIGLESASDFVLKNYVKKSFRFKDYLKASDVLKDLNLPLKTYVLLKPPFLTEKNAIEDFRKTILKIKDLTDSISVNPVCVMRGTPLEAMWRQRLYRPPWLWSLLEGLRFAKKEFLGEPICEPMMASTPKGVHNCGRCDREILFNLKRGIYENVECSCKLTWKKVLEIEERINGVVDERFFKRR